jgi:predicted nuclease of predicted toxin-antitoxin system
MLRLATDEDFNNRILRGLLRRNPSLNVLRVQDAGLCGQGDDEVLEWAATEGRILLTHDVTTMKQHVDERLAAGLPMPGVFELTQDVPIGKAIEEILLLAECSLEGEGEGPIRFLPFR